MMSSIINKVRVFVLIGCPRLVSGVTGVQRSAYPLVERQVRMGRCWFRPLLVAIASWGVEWDLILTDFTSSLISTNGTAELVTAHPNDHFEQVALYHIFI